ncbi:MAG: hypothetical protein A2W01_09550 [Candidatus Solincola sediminis]|nr:MAG: hypothetical protein A2W01_09550 [Candidatus Solincola sediminis]
MQAVRGLDAFHTGLALLPLSCGALVAAPLTGVLAPRIGLKRIIQTGLFLMVVGYILGAVTLHTDSTVASLIPGLALVGMGLGMQFGQIGNLTISAVSVEQAGEAAGVNNTFRQLGATLGTAVIGAVLIASITSSISAGIKASSIIPEPFKAGVETAVKEQVSNVEFGGGAELPEGIPVEIGNEIIDISHKSVTQANRIALGFAGGATFLALLASLLLPAWKREEYKPEALRSKVA